MTISVIIPVYNVRYYLEKCVSSVLLQSYSELEILLIDDGSTDGSGELCDVIAKRDSRVRVFHQANSGLSAARNAGIMAARGELLMFLDSDDFWLDSNVCEWVSTVFGKINMDVLEFGSAKFYEPHEPKHVVSKELSVKYTRVDEETKEQVFTDMIRSGYLTACAWNKAIRREFLLEHSLFFREGVIAEDIDWNARLMLYSKSVGGSHRPCVAYRKRRGSITSSVSKDKILQLISNLEYMLRELPLEPSYMRQYLAMHVANAYIGSAGLSLNLFEEICNRLRVFSLFLNQGKGIRVRVVRFLIGYLGCTATWIILRILHKLTH